MLELAVPSLRIRLALSIPFWMTCLLVLTAKAIHTRTQPRPKPWRLPCLGQRLTSERRTTQQLGGSQDTYGACDYQRSNDDLYVVTAGVAVISASPDMEQYAMNSGDVYLRVPPAIAATINGAWKPPAKRLMVLADTQ
jgi:hypothetical protein